MKTMNLEQMESVRGGKSQQATNLCNLGVGIIVGAAIVASGATGFGALIIGGLLGQYASNAFC